LATALVLAGGGSAQAAFIYGVSGQAYTQNFDTLPTSATTNTTFTFQQSPATDGGGGLNGWYYQISTTAYPATLTGSATNGGLGGGTTAPLSMGSLSATDRAFGFQNNGSHMVLQLRNNTGTTLTSFSLDFAGENWRSSTSTQIGSSNVAFAYFLSGNATTLTNFTTDTWTADTQFDFKEPTSAGSNAAIDGNAAINRVTRSGVVSNIAWQPGTDLYLRWSRVNGGAMLGLDDFTFSAVPEPGTAGLIAVAIPLMLRRYRRRQIC
jgi:hypothetical protein